VDSGKRREPKLNFARVQSDIRRVHGDYELS
jgi:hypothetical protein